MRDKINNPVRLDLMREAIVNIEEFMQGVDSFSDFIASKILCHAVVYNVQCIGENAYKLSKEFIAAHAEVEWNDIEGLRHVLVHDYYSVNMKIIWGIIQKDIPKLKAWLALHAANPVFF